MRAHIKQEVTNCAKIVAHLAISIELTHYWKRCQVTVSYPDYGFWPVYIYPLPNDFHFRPVVHVKARTFSG